MRLGKIGGEINNKIDIKMQIETSELRGRIINSSLFLEDEIDSLILKFMNYYGKGSKHQEEVFEIIKDQFIVGKTLGNKIALLKTIFKTKIFKEVYYFELIKFFEANKMKILNEIETYEKFYSTMSSKLTSILKIRNTVAHGKINYDMFMDIDEIKEEQKDREFILNKVMVKVSKSDEKIFHSDVSLLESLLKFTGVAIFVVNFDIESLKTKK